MESVTVVCVSLSLPNLELIDWLNEVAFKEECKYSDIEYAKKAYSIL